MMDSRWSLMPSPAPQQQQQQQQQGQQQGQQQQQAAAPVPTPPPAYERSLLDAQVRVTPTSALRREALSPPSSVARP